MNNYPKHYCGIFGIKGQPKAAESVYRGLFALQHRGEESCGIVSCEPSAEKVSFYEHKGVGLVSQVISESVLRILKGSMAIGHNRYSTTGGTGLQNAQPLSILYKNGRIALAHNGNLTNTNALRTQLEQSGAVFLTTTDSEVMLHLIARSNGSIEEAILDMMDQVEGAYSLVIMTEDKLICVRDPHGFRPLSVGILNGAQIVSSETCAFDILGAHFVRDVEPGEIIVFKDGEIQTLKSRKKAPKSLCSFCGIYFAKPDSYLEGRDVYRLRIAMGKKLAEEHPSIQADMVIPMPDGGICAALGYSRATGFLYEPILIRNHYIGRSFIKPSQLERQIAANFKLNLIAGLVKGKRVVIIDDSIVRGVTSQARVKKFKEAGASWVGMLISCPPHKHRCPYGIDFPDREDLIANQLDLEGIRKTLGLDYLGYLSEAGLIEVLGDGHCLACFNGKYPAG